MSVHQPGERAIRPLPLCRLHQQVRVPREQDTPVRGCPVEEFRVGEGTRVVLLRRQDIDPSKPEAFRYGTRDVNVHVQADAQDSRSRLDRSGRPRNEGARSAKRHDRSAIAPAGSG